MFLMGYPAAFMVSTGNTSRHPFVPYECGEYSAMGDFGPQVFSRMIDSFTRQQTTAKPSNTKVPVRRLVLTAELLLLFAGLPLAYLLGWLPSQVIVLLLPVAVYCLVVLLTDRTFDRQQLWNLRSAQRELPVILIRFLIAALGIGICVWFFAPHQFFNFPRSNPGLWALVMIAYPLLSVYPQELIFRSFFFHRYRIIFPHERLLIAKNAGAFGLMHAVFENWIAVGLSVVGGWLFATTYARTRSTAAVLIEHALYGCLIFTIGLGIFFFHGAIRR